MKIDREIKFKGEYYAAWGQYCPVTGRFETLEFHNSNDEITDPTLIDALTYTLELELQGD